MAISNDQVYKMLEKIQQDINLLRKEETEVLKEETQVLKEEGKIVMKEGKLMGLLNKKVNLQFDNIIDWKHFIWDTCEYKRPIEKNKEIDFICKKTGNKCRFQDCFRNKAKK
jgi:hypothetical protein